MSQDIPSAGEVRALLQPLRHAQLQALAAASGVPFTTLWKVRSGETGNPGLDTVRKFLPHVAKVAEAAA